MQKPRIRLAPEAASSNSDLSGSLWTPYPTASQARLSHPRLLFSAGCRLAELSEGVLTSTARKDDGGNATVPDSLRLHALNRELMKRKAAAPEMHQASLSNMPSFVILL